TPDAVVVDLRASEEALAALNHAIAARVDAGEVVTGPGVPASYAGDLAALRSTDRLLADEAARSFTCLKGQA
ncbi:MAG: hypothetical protein KC636_11420, partial [Myxococcales bacterium]|nr:hypothetical protein [Myxococcales bacterium]